MTIALLESKINLVYGNVNDKTTFKPNSKPSSHAICLKGKESTWQLQRNKLKNLPHKLKSLRHKLKSLRHTLTFACCGWQRLASFGRGGTRFLRCQACQ